MSGKTDTWPPRWTEPHFKGQKVGKVRAVTKVRAKKARKLKTSERNNKAEVRGRDTYCRFPKCSCKSKGTRLHVSHLVHKGAGGNPKGDRSTAAGMILLCAARHRESPIAIDKGTLKCVPLSGPPGTYGPVAWLIDLHVLPATYRSGPDRWIELARETSRHAFEPFTPRQLEILQHLATL